MKQFIFYLCIGFLAIFASCASTSDEIWINADGSGRYETKQDASSMAPIIKMGLMSERAQADANSGDSDPFMDIFKEGKVDTTLSFWNIMEQEAQKKDMTSMPKTKEEIKAALMKDEKGTPEEKEAMWSVMEMIMDLNFRIEMDLDNNIFKTTSSQDFESLDKMMFSEMGDLLEVLAKFDNNFSSSGLEDIEMMKNMMGSVPKYELTDNTLTISRDPVDFTKLDDEMQMALEMMKGFMKQSEYTSVIHLPGKVKKVNQKNATYKGNTVTWTIPYDALYDKNANLDLEIKFKAKKRKKKTTRKG